MKTLRWITICLIAVFSTTSVWAYTNRDLLQKAADLTTVKNSLLMNHAWVTYPDYQDRNGWDQLFGENKEDFIKKGERFLDYEWKVVKATDYLEFERTGNRRMMESVSGSNSQAIVALFMAELAEGKGRFRDQLVNGVFNMCEMTSWASSAHLEAQPSRRALPDHRLHYIDLAGGDMGATLSWIYYFMKDQFDEIDPIISLRLRDELQVRILDAYMENDWFWWMAFQRKPGGLVNNWNVWCNSNVLQCFLLLEEDRDKLAAAVYRTMRSVDQFINYNNEDGACEEGPAYWGHAGGKMYDYLQVLSDATGGKVNIFNVPMIRNMGEYIVRSYVGDGWVVNFADASAKGGGDPLLIYRYGEAVNSSLMENYGAYLYHTTDHNSLTTGRDSYRNFQNLITIKEIKNRQGEFKQPPYTWYPETEFCYMTNKNGFFLAAKGGHNSESHNHNDVGTFSLYINQRPVFIDAGVGTYTRQTFSGERYNIWTMQSNYHNLPVINGVPQSFGSSYRSSDVKFNPGSMRFSLNIASAYPESAAVNNWIRSYTLTDKEVRIEDTYDLKEASKPNEINFLVWGDIDITKAGEVLINTEKNRVRLIYNKEEFSPSLEKIELEDPRLSGVWGKEVFRVTLKANKLANKGKYSYKIETYK